MSYAGYLDRVRARNYATTRTPANVTINGPNSFTCLPPPPQFMMCGGPPPCQVDDNCSNCSDGDGEGGGGGSDCGDCTNDGGGGMRPDIQYVNYELPTGSIIFNYGIRVPQGWLLCNGNILNAQYYAGLIQVIGTNMLPNIPPLYPGGSYIIKY